MIQKDNRFTNLTVNNILFAKNHVRATHAEIGTLGFRDLTFTNALATNVKSTDITTKNETVTDGSSSNVLTVPISSVVTSDKIPQFVSNDQPKTTPISIPVPSGLNYFFMDGRDGNETVTSLITLSRDMYFDTLFIDAGGIINPNGHFIFCKTALILNGIIQSNGSNGGNAIGGVLGLGGNEATMTLFSVMNAIPGRNGGNANGNGSSSTMTNTVFGGLSGAGGNSDTKTGGTVTSTQIQYKNKTTFINNPAFFGLIGRTGQGGAIVAFGGVAALGGGGGAGGTGSGGGGGGGSAGGIFIISKTVSGTGSIEAIGGNGGNGANVNGGGGGGGGGGFVYILSSSNTLNASQINVAGGSGGASGIHNGNPGGTGVYLPITLS